MKLTFYSKDVQAEVAASVPAVPTRAEMLLEDLWDLTWIYPTVEDWKTDFERLKTQYTQLAKLKGTLTESPESLLKGLELQKEFQLTIERLYQYAMLQVSEDASCTAYLERKGQLRNLLTRIDELSSFIEPEIQSIDDATWEAWMKAPVLKEWVTYLQKMRRFKAHTLSESEERLLALSHPTTAGHRETFSQLTNVDMKFGVLKDEEGREVPLTQTSFASFLNQRNRDVRRNAFHQFYNEFADHRFSLASALASSVKGDVFHARARNYPSALESALFPDQIPMSVYDNLIKAVHEGLEPLYEYYELRRRALQLDEIHHYDTYVPIVSEVEKKTSFDEAIELVLAALEPLGKEYVNILGEGLQKQRWCDRYETKGKRSGAFSAGCFGTPPYILMNYRADVFSDVYTLAHEAGHSMHTWYSQKTQRFQDYDYPIFLAEVASTFNEELLTHYLLEQTTDKNMRAYLINRQLDDLRGTLYRQTMFAEFEKIVHAMDEAGEALTLDAFENVYYELLARYFGPKFALDNELKLECLRIPHFYTGFYVYKYATGISAAVALSDRVLHGGKEELNAYLGFLKSGGSQAPLDTLQSAGVDMRNPKAIETTIQLFGQRVNELKDLLSL